MEEKKPKNLVILEGNLGQKPDAVNTSSNILMSKSSIAVSRKKGNEFESMWVNLVAFGPTAGHFANLDKGDKIRIEGRLNINKKEDKTYTNVVVDRLEVVRKKSEFPLEKRSEKSSREFDDIPF